MERAKTNTRLYYLVFNAFPTGEEVATWAELSYKHAGIFFYGENYERKFYLVHLQGTVTKLSVEPGKVPKYDAGIRKMVKALLSDYLFTYFLKRLQLKCEAWALRGKIKRDVTSIVKQYYPIFPRAGQYDNHPNPSLASNRFTKNRAQTLLGIGSKDAMYIYGSLEPGVPSLLLLILELKADSG